MRRLALLPLVGLGTWLWLWPLGHAEACGCFAPPSPAQPVVQAGERILFARRDGIITAHIQIQYAGSAADFGWLLPLPSVPTLELGADELFTLLGQGTQPTYTLTPIYENCSTGRGSGGGGFSLGCGGADSAAYAAPDAGRPAADAGGVVVVQSSIGPYDYAVLRADARKEMLDWLDANGYYVPSGTGDAVGPYIHGGGYFLALKLRSGAATGDIQPVVVHYASDLPMIPIILTSVGATPDMGIQVFVLGQGRAIPRNYAHTIINDARIDWVNGAGNYGAVIAAATHEASGRHTFVTEYAGSSAFMKDRLLPPGRYGTLAELAAQPDIYAFCSYLAYHGFQQSSLRFPRVVTDILAAAAPMPEAATKQGITPAQFYGQLAYYRQTYPALFEGWSPPFVPADAAGAIDEDFVKPLRSANALFADGPYLTRLYTTLSPEDMTKDPVFSENRSLPDVSPLHAGTLTYHCGGDPAGPYTPVTVKTGQGSIVSYPGGTASPPALGGLVGSRRIEILAEEGPAATVVDNSAKIAAFLAALEPAKAPAKDEGCRLARGPVGGAAWLLGLVALRLAAGRRRRAGRSR